MKSINCIECPELRDLILYLGMGVDLEANQLPHRTKLAEMIAQRFVVECDRLKEDIKVCAVLPIEFRI